MANEMENEDEGLDLESEGAAEGQEPAEGGQGEQKAKSDEGEQVSYKELLQHMKETKAESARREALLREEVSTTKQTFAQQQERLRQAILGEDDPKKKAILEAKKEQIKKDFYELFPKAKEMFEGDPNAEREPSVETKRFWNQSRQKAAALATEIGFKTPEQQDAWLLLGDLLIHKNEAWYNRYYKNGDDTVITEVSKFLEEKVILPFKEEIRKQVLSEIRRGQRFAQPDTVGASSSGGQRPERPIDEKRVQKEFGDLKDSKNRGNLYSKIFDRAIKSVEQE